MENKERDLFKTTKEVISRLFDQKSGPTKISAQPMDEATDQITVQDRNGEQVIRVSKELGDSTS